MARPSEQFSRQEFPVDGLAGDEAGHVVDRGVVDHVAAGRDEVDRGEAGFGPGSDVTSGEACWQGRR